MKCKVLRCKSKNMEDDVNEFLQANSGLNIKFITQAVHSGGLAYTTLYYEE